MEKTQNLAIGSPSTTSPMKSVETKSGSKSIFRRVSNRALHLLARMAPGAMSVRPFLHRLRGVKIGSNVFIGEDVYLENEYPERVEIREGVQVGLRSTIIAHTRGPSRVIIEKNAFIGASCIIAVSPGKTLTIGEGSVLGVGSCVTNDIPANTFYAGEKAKPIAKVTIPLTADTSYLQFIRGLRPLQK
jgi:serine acetyltransferase